jgi:hypothetical protein
MQDGKQIFSYIEKLRMDKAKKADPHQRFSPSRLPKARPEEVELKKMQKDEAFFDLEIDVNVEGDIRVVLYDHDNMPPREEVACFLWFHTGFVTTSPLVFEKYEIDMAWSDKKCKVFDQDFKMEFYFEEVPTEVETFEKKTSALSQLRRQHTLERESKAHLLGLWHSMPTPNPRTLERAAKYRGGVNSTNKRESFSIVIDDGLIEGNTLE